MYVVRVLPLSLECCRIQLVFLSFGFIYSCGTSFRYPVGGGGVTGACFKAYLHCTGHYEVRFVVTNGGVVVGEGAVGYAFPQASPRGGALLNYNDLQSEPHLFGGKGKIVIKNKTKNAK